MPATFDKLGIRFQYPDNWTLEADQGKAGQRTISVYSPGAAFWTVILRDRHEDPNRLVHDAVAAMRKEYDELDEEAVQDEIGGVEMVGSDLNFYCLDLTNTAKIRAFRARAGTYLVICQAEDREFEQVAKVFQAITTSLLR